MSWCAVVYCHNCNLKNKDKSYFALPKDTKVRNAWIRAINRTELPKKVYVCSDHFEEKCFDQSWKLQSELFYQDRTVKRKLLPGSIPTIFSQKEKPKERSFSKSRSEKKKNKEVRFSVKWFSMLGRISITSILIQGTYMMYK